jgi:uracil-DNA glycosylase
VDVFSRIRTEIEDDPANRLGDFATQRPLFQAGAGARILIVGQAPGRRTQESGVPWDDASGVKLRSWLAVTPDQFYDADLVALLPMDFYFPGKGNGGDLPPRKGFAAQWHPRLIEQMPGLRLKLLIGGYAQKFYLGTAAKPTLTETVRAFREYPDDELPLVHPSPLNFRWQARNPWFDEQVVPELRRRTTAALR